MRVVFPAPFVPTSPNTTPRGIARLTSDRASPVPKRRERLRISMTCPLLRVTSTFTEDSLGGALATHDGVAFVDQVFQLVHAHTHMARVCQQRVNPLSQ